MRIAIVLVLGQVSPVAAEPQGMTLEKVIGMAVAGRETVQAEMQRTEAADSRLDRARALFFPDVTLSGTYTRRAYETKRMVGGELVTVQSRNALNANATLSMTLFDARNFPLHRQAKLQLNAAKLTLADTRRQVAFEAATTYLDVLSAENVVAAAERRLDLAKQTLDQAAQRSRSGLAGSNDATRAELEWVSAERDLARVQGDLQRARLMLEYVINGKIAGALTEPTELIGRAQRTRAIADSQKAREQRLDLQAARAQALALDAAADEPGLRWVPTVGLLGQVRTTNEAGLNNRDVDGFVAVTATWVLWDGGERRAEEAEKRALASASEFEVKALDRQVEREVKEALVLLSTGQTAQRQAEAAARAARQNSKETNELYRQGLSTALAQADANLRLFEAEVERIRARYDTARAFLELRRALGLDPMGRPVQ